MITIVVKGITLLFYIQVRRTRYAASRYGLGFVFFIFFALFVLGVGVAPTHL